MITIPMEIPDEILVNLKMDAKAFARDLKMLAAVKLFELGKLSSGRAAQLAGMPRVEFLLSLRDYQVAPFRLPAEELRQDVLNA